MQLHHSVSKSDSITTVWTFNRDDHELDLEIHGCGCGDGCDCTGCDCTGCDCTGGNDADDGNGEDDDDSAANVALAAAINEAAMTAATAAAEAEFAADYAEPPGGYAPTMATHNVAAVATELATSGFFAATDGMELAAAAAKSLGKGAVGGIAVVAAAEVVEAVVSPGTTRLDEAVEDVARFSGQMAQVEADGQAALQNAVVNAAVNAVEDAGERSLAELQAQSALTERVAEAISNALGAPEDPNLADGDDSDSDPNQAP